MLEAFPASLGSLLLMFLTRGWWCWMKEEIVPLLFSTTHRGNSRSTDCLSLFPLPHPHVQQKAKWLHCCNSSSCQGGVDWGRRGERLGRERERVCSLSLPLSSCSPGKRASSAAFVLERTRRRTTATLSVPPNSFLHDCMYLIIIWPAYQRWISAHALWSSSGGLLHIPPVEDAKLVGIPERAFLVVAPQF